MKKKNIIGLAVVTAALALSTSLATAGNWITNSATLPLDFSNMVALVTTTVTSNNVTWSGGMEIPPNVPWSVTVPLQPLTNGVAMPAGGGTNTSTFGFALSQDNVNWTAPQFTVSASFVGSNSACAGTNFTKDVYAGWRYVKPIKATTTASNYVYAPYWQLQTYQ